MGKIGTYEYPEISVEETIKIAELLVNEFHKKVSDVNVFAERVGHKSSSSGTFLVKMGDVRKYGIMEKRDYQATKRAEILANPTTPQEKNQETKDMILGVPLFEKLNSRLKTKSPTLEQFRTQLIEVTNDREKGSKEAEKIRKIYIDAISHIREDQQQQPTDSFNNMGQELIQPQGNSDLILLRAGNYNLSLPKNDSSISVLITILEDMKEKKSKEK